eukprot:6472669-Amphidinium_carterae.2
MTLRVTQLSPRPAHIGCLGLVHTWEYNWACFPSFTCTCNPRNADREVSSGKTCATKRTCDSATMDATNGNTICMHVHNLRNVEGQTGAKMSVTESYLNLPLKQKTTLDSKLYASSKVSSL